MILNLPSDGITLRFEPGSQRLSKIEVYDVPKVKLFYSGTTFSAPEVTATFNLIYQLFGPSFPGDYNNELHSYFLHYPGLSFQFPIPAKFQSLYANDLPLEFPDGTTPVIKRVFVYGGVDMKSPVPPPLNDLQFPYYFEPIRVHVNQYVEFSLRNKRLSFKSTPQDVVSELGSPNRVFYKEVDKMRIHASGDSSKLVDTISGTGCADYFYNYFDLGIDILFDAQKHRIRKFVLHTNFPGHIDFNQYMKCNFHVSSQSILLSLRNNRFSTESEPEVPLHDSRTENESPLIKTLSLKVRKR